MPKLSLLLFAIACPAFANQSDFCTARLLAGLAVPEVFRAHVPRFGDRAHVTARLGDRRVRLDRRAVTTTPIQLISVVVPVYRELRNGNLARLIDMLAEQDAGVTVRLVAVVNNTPDVAMNEADPILIENKESVKFLRDASARVDFPIEVIDETGGFPRNMGLLRNRGLFRALELGNVDPQRHVIVNFDADAEMPEGHLRHLVQYYDRFPLDAVLARRGLTIPADAPRELFQSHYHSAYRHLLFDASQILLYPGEGASTPQITVRARVAREMGGFAAWDENEDLEFGARLGQRLTLLAPDLMITQSDRVREDGFDAARGLKLIRRHLQDDEYVPSPVPVSKVGAQADHLNERISRWLQRETARGRITFEEGMARFARATSRFHLGQTIRFGSLITPYFEEWRPVVLDFAAVRSARFHPRTFKLLKSFVCQDQVSAVNRYSSSTSGYLYHCLHEYLTSAEHRALRDQIAWRTKEVARRAELRRGDVLAMIQHGAPPLDPAASEDSFRAHLRRDSSLSRDVRAQIARFSRPARFEDRLTALTADDVLGRLTKRYPDWLGDTGSSDGWVLNVEVLRAMLGWVLEAMADPEDYPGTTEFLNALMPPE